MAGSSRCTGSGLGVLSDDEARVIRRERRTRRR